MCYQEILELCFSKRLTEAGIKLLLHSPLTQAYSIHRSLWKPPSLGTKLGERQHSKGKKEQWLRNKKMTDKSSKPKGRKTKKRIHPTRDSTSCQSRQETLPPKKNLAPGHGRSDGGRPNLTWGKKKNGVMIQIYIFFFKLQLLLHPYLAGCFKKIYAFFFFFPNWCLSSAAFCQWLHWDASNQIWSNTLIKMWDSMWILKLKTNQRETVGSNSWKQCKCMPLKCSSEPRALKNGFGPINLTEMEYRTTNTHFSRTSLVPSGKSNSLTYNACANRRKHQCFLCSGVLFNHNKE